MKPYDIIIAGAGLGGLATAAILSKYGFSVCVVEKHFQPGGSLQNFTRKGVVFDTGAHYVGGVDEGQNLQVILKFLGVWDRLNLKKMDEDAYDIFTFVDRAKTYVHAQGFDFFKTRLLEQFPKEEKALQAYIKLIQDIANDYPLFKFKKTRKTIFDSEYLHTPLAIALKKITKNVELQNALTGNNLLYAGEFNRTPVSVHGLIHYSYVESAYRFVDGASQLTHALVDEVKKNGGEVMLNAKVERFDFDNSHIRSITLADGRVIEGKNFISNIHPSSTFRLIDEHHVRKVFRNRMLNLENTCSIFTLYGVFKDKAFPYLNSNHYIYRGDNVWSLENYDKETWPAAGLFLTQPAKGQSEYAKGFTMMVYMKYEEVKAWENTTIEKRGDAYKEFKEEKTARVMDLIEQKFPGFRSSVAHVYTSTPLTYRDYTGTERGSLYGVVRDANDSLKNLVLPNTKISNLFFVGQNTVLHGVLGVLIGSLLVSSNFINFDKLLDDLNTTG